jgi:hypothetical protein
VPSRHGIALGCPPAVGPQPSACVGLEGTTAYRIFDLEFENFDVPHGYLGIDGKPVGHVFLEARMVTDAPGRPCIGGTRVGVIRVKSWRTTLYVCPNDSLYIERVARHGEGTNVGHILLEWKDAGVDYIASAHGHTTANLELLRQLVDSVVLVSPQG